MDKKLIDLLLEMDFTKNEIKDMENLAPMLEVTTLDEVKDVIKVLVKYGFPKEDLSELFYQNPNIMAMDKDVLAKELDKIVEKNKDVETYLKNNPFAI